MTDNVQFKKRKLTNLFFGFLRRAIVVSLILEMAIAISGTSSKCQNDLDLGPRACDFSSRMIR